MLSTHILLMDTNLVIGLGAIGAVAVLGIGYLMMRPKKDSEMGLGIGQPNEDTGAVARRQAEEAARRQAEEAARRQAEEDAKRKKAEEEAAARKKAEAEAAAKKKAEEEAAAKKKAEEEAAARKRAEEEAAARKKAEAEAAARKQAEEAAARKQAEEAAARKRAEEEAAARKQAEDAAARKRAEEEAARKRAEAEAAARKQAEDAARRQAEETKRKAEEAARRAAEAARQAAPPAMVFDPASVPEPTKAPEPEPEPIAFGSPEPIKKGGEPDLMSTMPLSSFTPPPGMAMPPIAAPAAPKIDPSQFKGSEQSHKTAQRVARTIVSDIKIYNEKKVIEGRKARNLYDLLKKEFDHGFKTYEDRVEEVVRGESNYLYEIIVERLCEGDAGCLGPNYPKDRGPK